MTRRSRQHGYVLLMTLLLLALAAAGMSSICLKSLGRVAESRIAQENLQRRWGVISCQAVLAERAEAVLTKTEKKGGRPIRMVSRTLRLGEQTFHLVFCDEQAKANINILFERKGRPGATAAVQFLLREMTLKLAVQLHPAIEKGKLSFGSFGQVFSDNSPQNLISYEHPESSGTADLTCWGTGRLNVRRASPAAFKQVCGSILGDAEVDRLIYLRRNNPSLTLEELLVQLDLPLERQQQLMILLTDRSSCHALWIICQGKSRSWYDLYVVDQGVPGRSTTAIFRW